MWLTVCMENEQNAKGIKGSRWLGYKFPSV